MTKFEDSLENFLEKHSEMHIELMTSYNSEKRNKHLQEERSDRCKLISQAEKEFGRNKFLKEIIPKLEAELKKLEEDYRKLDEKRLEVKGKPEYKKLLKTEGLEGSLKYFIDWSRMTPEERERKLESDERIRKAEEKEEAAIKKLESTLTKEQLELRKEALEFIRSTGYQIVGCTIDMEKLEKVPESTQKKAREKFGEIMGKAGNDPDKIRELLCEGDTMPLTTAPQEFEDLYKSYKKGENLVGSGCSFASDTKYVKEKA